MNPRSLLITLAIGLFFLAQSSFAGDITLAWDAPSDTTGVAGYLLCYGDESGQYTTEIDVGDATTYTLSNLDPGAYFFAVKAYGTEGEQSPFSNELFAMIDLPLVTVETMQVESRVVYILCNWGKVPAIVEWTIDGADCAIVLDPGAYLMLDSLPEDLIIRIPH